MAPTLLTVSPLNLIIFYKLVEALSYICLEVGDGWWWNIETNKTQTLSKDDCVYTSP